MSVVVSRKLVDGCIVRAIRAVVLFFPMLFDCVEVLKWLIILTVHTLVMFQDVHAQSHTQPEGALTVCATLHLVVGVEPLNMTDEVFDAGKGLDVRCFRVTREFCASMPITWKYVAVLANGAIPTRLL